MSADPNGYEQQAAWMPATPLPEASVITARHFHDPRVRMSVLSIFLGNEMVAQSVLKWPESGEDS